MIVYIPTPITSAEQAESLPEGTLVPRPQSPHVVKWEDGAWRYVQGSGGALSKMLVGDTALVPIEAEEEWGVEMSENGEVTHVVRATSRENAEWTLGHQQPGTARIVRRTPATPWEPVSGPDHRGDGA